MSVEIRVHCDMCGERVLMDRTHLVIKCGPERIKRAEGVDLCPSCSPKVFALVDARVDGSTAPSPRRKASKVAAEKANGATPRATAAR